MRTSRHTFILGLAIMLCLSLHAQMESRLTYRRYTTLDGLPQMQAERLWQDSHGYIYIGTLSGFIRFDGRTFTPFLKGRRENIVGFIETDGQVSGLGFRRQWLIDDDDVVMHPIDPQGYWQLNNLNAGSLPDGYILLEDEQEQHRRLCRVTEQGFVTRMTGRLLDEMTPDRKLYMDTISTLIPTENGLYQVRKGQRQAVRLTGKGDIYTLLRTNTALLAFASDGIYAVSDHRLKRLIKASWTEASFGLTVRQLQSGHLVIADEHAVYLYDGTAIHKIVTGINLIRDVLIDRWDRLWVATYQGVYCFFNRNFTNHRLTDENDIVRAVAVLPSSNAADSPYQLVMGTLNGKVITKRGEGTDEYMVISDDASQYYGTSTVTIGRQVFMPSHNDVACVEGNPTTALHYLNLPQDRFRFLTQADGKLILVSQKSVIAAFDPQTQQTDTLTTDIPYPWCAAFDDEGRLWAGSTLGVFCLDRNGKVEKADYPQKLLVTTMEADSKGTIFFASADSLFMIRKGQISNLNAPLDPKGHLFRRSQEISSLNGHEIRSLHVSPRGYLVVATVDVLFVCRIGKDYQLTDIHFFNHHNGFTMLEPLMATMAESSDGTVWLPGVEEMTSFRPEELLAINEEDTYIAPPLRWWQHWWVWLLGLLILSMLVWTVAYWYEKRRNRRRMIRLQREKLQREQQIKAIREKAKAPLISPQREDSRCINTSPRQGRLEGVPGGGLEGALKDIVRMTEKSYEEHLTFRTASGTIVANVKDIAYFKGDGNYSQIVTFHDKDTVLVGLGSLEKTLSPEVFVRADRSTLVNIHLICTLLPKQRRCIFRSPDGREVETTLLAPAFKRLQDLLH